MCEAIIAGCRRAGFWVFGLSLCFLIGGQAAAQQSYEISIAGYTFDPIDVENVVPAELRMSPENRRAYGESANYYLVQLQSTITPELTSRLKEQYGLRLQEYVPELTYVERLEPAILERLSDDEAIRAVVAFEPAFKISPSIGTKEYRSEERRALSASGLLLNVVLFADADPEATAQSLSRLGATEIEISDLRQYGSTVRIQLVLPLEQDVRDVARLPEVRWIEEVAEYDEDNGNTAGTMQSGTPGVTPVWDIGIHGEGQTISVMEGRSADINHCMFIDPANPVGAAHRKVQSTFGSTGDHATFVSGIAVGDDINNPGTGANRGNAWAARLVNVVSSTTNMLAQLNTSAATGTSVHTNSWHGVNVNAANQALYDQISSDVDTFVWNNEDHVVLGSMGNVGEEQGPPGTAKNAIGINAGTTFPNIMNFGDGNAGPTAGGRRKPDVVTPGCNIQSSRSGTACTINQRGVCATSWATPAAAAASTLIRQYYVDGYYPNGASDPTSAFTPSGALIKATLINGTIDMTGIAGYPSNQEGWGLVRLDNVLYFQDDDHLLQAWETRNSNGLTTGGSRTHLFNVTDDDRPLIVTLVWTDAPAAAGAANPAINNLNLRVVSPDASQTFRGNVFAGGQSTTGGAADTLNNVEQVVINTPAEGQWRLLVDAAAVNVGNPGQGYGLVASAGREDLVPQIQIPGDVTFGDVCVGTTATEALDVCNAGNAVLEVSGISTSNPVFPVTVPSGGYPLDVGAGSCFPFQANFSPVAAGPQSAQLGVQSNDPVSPVTQIQATGTGVVADIEASGSTDFGTVSAWSSGERTVEVCNVGACGLTFTSAAVDCPDFTIVDDPSPVGLAAGACTGLTTKFTPTVPGAHACTLSINSDDPDTPVVTKTLTARTPPAFSIHAGRANAKSALKSTNDDGLTINLDFIQDINANWAWDVRLGISRLGGKGGNPDIDVWTVSGNARWTINPLGPVRAFLNGGLGLYQFDPGDLELGANLGAGLRLPLSPRFSLEATYNYQNAFTASPDLEFDQLQVGLLISF